MSKLRQMHIQSFFQGGLSELDLAERRKKLFEAEYKRDADLIAELQRQQAELERRELDTIHSQTIAKEQAALQEERQRLAAQLILLQRKQEDRMTNDVGKEVAAGLFVGSQDAAENKEWIRQAGIRAIVNCTPDVPNFHESDEDLDLAYFRLQLEDSSDFDLISILGEACQFVKSALNRGNTLVHCKMGQSRSCAVVIGHLISLGINFATAHEMVEKVRPLISLNKSFVLHLENFHLSLGSSRPEPPKTPEHLSTSQDNQDSESNEQDDVQPASQPTTIANRRVRRAAASKPSIILHDESDEESKPNPKKRKAPPKASSKKWKPFFSLHSFMSPKAQAAAILKKSQN